MTLYTPIGACAGPHTDVTHKVFMPCVALSPFLSQKKKKRKTVLYARRGCCPFLLFSLKKMPDANLCLGFLSSCSFLPWSLRKMPVANLRLGPGAIALRGIGLVNLGVFPERERASERERAHTHTRTRARDGE